MTRNQNHSSILQPLQQSKSDIFALQEQLTPLLTSLATKNIGEVYDSLSGLDADLKQIYQELEHPVLKMATVGTTSAGKSTFVNGILGEYLAPTDPDEKSVGILKITSASNWSIQTHPNTPETDHLNSVLEICQFLDKAMERTKDQPIIPIFTVKGPLYPLTPRHEFMEITGGQVNLQILDLPGLRNADQDVKNFKIIQNQVGQSFCVVLLDMTKMFSKEEKIKLLQELKETVRDLGGDTTTMIFIANKIDSYTTQDLKNSPLSERLTKAKKEICSYLEKSLDEFILLPFSAQLYCNATSILKHSLEENEKAQPLRKALIDDTSFRWVQMLIEYSLQVTLPEEKKEEIKNLWRKIDDDLDKEEPSDFLDLTNAAKYALMASGHGLFWQSLAERFSKKSSQLLVFPITNQPLKKLRITLGKLLALSKIQQKTSLEQLEDMLSNLNQLKEATLSQLDVHNQKLEKKLNRLEQLLQFKDLTQDASEKDKQEKFDESLEFNEILIDIFDGDTKSYPNLMTVRNVTGQIKGEIFENILIPFTTFLKQKKTISELNALFTKLFGEELTKELTDKYEHLKDTDYHNLHGKTHVYVSGQRDDMAKKLNAVLEPLVGIHVAIRRGLNRVAERKLKTSADLIGNEIASFLISHASNIWKQIIEDLQTSSLLPTEDIELLPTILNSPNLEQSISIDDILFFQDPILSKNKDIRVIDGYRTVEGSCFDSSEPKYTTKNLTTIRLPTPEEIQENMLGGLDRERNALFERLGTCLKKSTTLAFDDLKINLEKYFSFLEQTIERRKQELSEETVQTVDFWANIQSKTTILDHQIQNTQQKILQ